MLPACATPDIGLFRPLQEWDVDEVLSADRLDELPTALDRIKAAHPPMPVNRQLFPSSGGLPQSDNYPIGQQFIFASLPTADPAPEIEVQHWAEGDVITAGRLQQQVRNVRMVTQMSVQPANTTTRDPFGGSTDSSDGGGGLPSPVPIPTNTFLGRLSDWMQEDVLTAEHLNEPIRILNAVYLGVHPPVTLNRTVHP